jgi:thymidylate synthase (FAD)
MKIIKPYYEIMTPIDGEEILKFIELIGRVSYKSEDKITSESSKVFVDKIVKNEHESVLEHFNISVRYICDRGVSHELVRHRIASYTQESTRYCNYSKDKFGNEITVIEPLFWEKGTYLYQVWYQGCICCEMTYFDLLKNGATTQEARNVLPNSLKTEIVSTMNLREWKHFFKMRTAKSAHPQMRELTVPLLEEFKQKIPIIFDNISVI